MGRTVYMNTHPSFRSQSAFDAMVDAMHAVGFSITESDKHPKFCFDLSAGSQARGTSKEYYIRWDGTVVDYYDHTVICPDVFAPTAAATIVAFRSNQPFTTKCAG